MIARPLCPVCGSSDVILVPTKKPSARKTECLIETAYLCDLGHMFKHDDAGGTLVLIETTDRLSA